MYSKCDQPKLIWIGQIVKLVGKWPMADCYFILCIHDWILAIRINHI